MGAAHTRTVAASDHSITNRRRGEKSISLVCVLKAALFLFCGLSCRTSSPAAPRLSSELRPQRLELGLQKECESVATEWECPATERPTSSPLSDTGEPSGQRKKHRYAGSQVLERGDAEVVAARDSLLGALGLRAILSARSGRGDGWLRGRWKKRHPPLRRDLSFCQMMLR